MSTVLALALAGACDGEAPPDDDGGTDHGGAATGTSGHDDGTTGADDETECTPPAIECIDPDTGDEPTCTASAAGESPSWHVYELEGQGGTQLTCPTTTFGPEIQIHCGDVTVLLQLETPEPIVFPWGEDEPVEVSWFHQGFVGGNERELRITSEAGVLLFEGRHHDFSIPGWDEHEPVTVDTHLDRCCGDVSSVGLSFSVDGGDAVTLFSQTSGVVSGQSGRYAAYVNTAWYDHCPPQHVTDYSKETFDFFVVRVP